MTIHYETTNIHWNYYKAIETDFKNMSRYIEFSESNNNTFSIELAKIIMSSAQETDVIMKSLCKLLDNSKSPRTIDGYRRIIKDKCPELINEQVRISRFGMTSKPWLNWNGDTNPDWWIANNNIKHNRSNSFEKANFINAFNSIGGLLISVLYYYKLDYEKSKGESISWKDLTHEINAIDSFMKLRGEYYYNPLIV